MTHDIKVFPGGPGRAAPEAATLGRRVASTQIRIVIAGARLRTGFRS